MGNTTGDQVQGMVTAGSGGVVSCILYGRQTVTGADVLAKTEVLDV